MSRSVAARRAPRLEYGLGKSDGAQRMIPQRVKLSVCSRLDSIVTQAIVVIQQSKSAVDQLRTQLKNAAVPARPTTVEVESIGTRLESVVVQLGSVAGGLENAVVRAGYRRRTAGEGRKYGAPNFGAPGHKKSQQL
ncbi:hypothetical protein GN958_ATG18610 [Phytophthora infestans]|uniref:Uncharacterized protein n=1 Tax=Phytophthora infestans TaxID=4787 RepID=A0A8S9U247_PHYIN|nr:hypothetical protein GN958_ATG18610 [Phytophthora infestans]